jgi:hypothetical protein
VGAGRSQEAEYTLLDDLPAGEWRLVADGIIVFPVDTTFEILYRPAAGGDDVVIGTWDRHWDPLPVGYTAQAYEVTTDGPFIDQQPGDQLVFRYTGTNTQPTQTMAYIPNGDGEEAGGRIPYIVLPR